MIHEFNCITFFTVVFSHFNSIASNIFVLCKANTVNYLLIKKNILRVMILLFFKESNLSSRTQEIILFIVYIILCTRLVLLSVIVEYYFIKYVISVCVPARIKKILFESLNLQDKFCVY